MWTGLLLYLSGFLLAPIFCLINYFHYKRIAEDSIDQFIVAKARVEAYRLATGGVAFLLLISIYAVILGSQILEISDTFGLIYFAVIAIIMIICAATFVRKRSEELTAELKRAQVVAGGEDKVRAESHQQVILFAVIGLIFAAMVLLSGWLSS